MALTHSMSHLSNEKAGQLLPFLAERGSQPVLIRLLADIEAARRETSSLACCC